MITMKMIDDVDKDDDGSDDNDNHMTKTTMMNEDDLTFMITKEDDRQC